MENIHDHKWDSSFRCQWCRPDLSVCNLGSLHTGQSLAWTDHNLHLIVKHLKERFTYLQHSYMHSDFILLIWDHIQCIRYWGECSISSRLSSSCPCVCFFVLRDPSCSCTPSQRRLNSCDMKCNHQNIWLQGMMMMMMIVFEGNFRSSHSDHAHTAPPFTFWRHPTVYSLHHPRTHHPYITQWTPPKGVVHP